MNVSRAAHLPDQSPPPSSGRGTNVKNVAAGRLVGCSNPLCAPTPVNVVTYVRQVRLYALEVASVAPLCMITIGARVG